MTDAELNDAVLDWLADDDTGLSSQTIALWITGRRKIKGWGAHTPSDPADLGRCLRLIDRIPVLRERLGEMAECSEEWRHMLIYWDEIEQSMRDEVGADWSKARSAPKTYDLMKTRERLAA